MLEISGLMTSIGLTHFNFFMRFIQFNEPYDQIIKKGEKELKEIMSIIDTTTCRSCKKEYELKKENQCDIYLYRCPHCGYLYSNY